jgi:hypothetical protein
MSEIWLRYDKQWRLRPQLILYASFHPRLRFGVTLLIALSIRSWLYPWLCNTSYYSEFALSIHGLGLGRLGLEQPAPAADRNGFAKRGWERLGLVWIDPPAAF